MCANPASLLPSTKLLLTLWPLFGSKVQDLHTHPSQSPGVPQHPHLSSSITPRPSPRPVDSTHKDLEPSHSPPCPLLLPYLASLGNESTPSSSHPSPCCQDGSHQPRSHQDCRSAIPIIMNSILHHPCCSLLRSQGFENNVTLLELPQGSIPPRLPL